MSILNHLCGNRRGLFIIGRSAGTYSRRLIGWDTGSSLAKALPLAAPEHGQAKTPTGRGLLNYSDRGYQYHSATYRSALFCDGCSVSMRRRYNCYDNAAMESFWSTLKHELYYCRRFAT